MRSRTWVLCLLLGACDPASPRALQPPLDMAMPGEGDGGGGGGSDGGAMDLGGGGDMPSCPGNCSVGAKSCDGNGVRACAPSGSCTDWGAAVACGSGTVCSGGACVATCANQCTAGTTYCSGTGYRTCVTAASGCTDWSFTVTACSNGTVCSGGVCAATCSDRCATSATQCTGQAVQSCEKKATGCLDWSDPTPCPMGTVCSAGQCSTSCTDQCSSGAMQCMGTDSIQTCAKQASGCLDWSPAQVCSSGSCAGGVCVPCTNNAKRCGSSGNVEQCTGGNWAQVMACAFGCNTGACVSNTTCTAGAYRCNGNTVEICNSTGTAYLYAASCANSCASGLCTGGCTAGAKRCNGNTLEQCNATGTMWNSMSTCANGCDGLTATCVLASLNITVNTTLDGDVVVAGPVTIASPAVVTSATGVLNIRAQSINLQAGASIAITPTGTTPDGTARPSCNNTMDGAGGGYATAGGYGACQSSADAGPAFGSSTDAIVQPGGQGGNGYCSGNAGVAGGKGGGVLRLTADTIVISGQISAKGQDGLASGSSCGGGSGGGSGGGILIAADDLTVNSTAIVSASGGNPGTGTSWNGGKGGDGRIKLLYGSKKSVTVSGISPAPTLDLLAPLTITSSTHPDQTLWYNDGFPSVGVTWVRPFAAVQGYWYKVDTTNFETPKPDPSSTFTQNEQVSIDPASLAPGANSSRTSYFHVAPVDATSTPGGVEDRFRIQVTSMPPVVSSSTHPVQTTWYTGSTVFFTWMLPAPASDDRNFQGYHYVLDHFGDTIPGTADTFLPVGQKQLTLANLDAGIWAFHLISVDTKGYFTSKPQTYIVRIGSAPGNGNVSGQVFESTASGPVALQGVTISVNHHLFAPDVSSAADGTFNFGGNVPVGMWDVEASKTGYLPQSQTLNVPSAGAMVTFTMMKKP